MTEITELDKAKELLQKDLDERTKKCSEEIKQVLDKWGFNLQPAPTMAFIREFAKLIPLCNVNLVANQQRDNGDKREVGKRRKAENDRADNK